jgi:Protein of unknown function (DUF2971)
MLLYKFRDWKNENHKKLLREREIYFPSPNDFNDPFDCFLMLRYDLLPDKEKKLKYEEFYRSSHPDASTSEVQLHIKRWERLKLIETNYLLSNSEKMLRDNNERIGILSLTKTKTPILLWSHYANSHKGFAVGFDSKMLIENILYSFNFIHIDARYTDVDYSTDYPIIIPSKTNDIETKLKPLSTKSKEWSYEQEYRIILFDGPRERLKLKPNVFSEIILGCNIEQKDKNEIVTITRTNFPNVRLFQAKKYSEKYSLIFEEI